MVNMSEIIAYLDTMAPKEYAEEYDNVGLLIGDKNKQVKKILVTLDADERTSDEAKSIGADLVISHHPLIFSPVRSLTTDDSISRTIISFIKNDIALFSMHTNFDSVKSGLNDLFLDKIAKTTNRKVIDGDGENGIGRIADLESSAELSLILGKIKKEFNLENVRFIGDENKIINKIAVVNGGGAEYVFEAKMLGADCFVSGDIKYHQARFAYENDISLIEIPHYNAEIIFSEFVKKLILDKFGDKVEVYVSIENVDIWKTLD